MGGHHQQTSYFLDGLLNSRPGRSRPTIIVSLLKLKGYRSTFFRWHKFCLCLSRSFASPDSRFNERARTPMSRKRGSLPREIFLSHSSRDRTFVQDLVKMMRGHGLPVWYSPTHILGAQQWHDEIGSALARCD